MTQLTIQLDDAAADALRQLAAIEQRSETEILCTALAAYSQTGRPRPKGVGQYHSGRHDISVQAKNLLREDVTDRRWL